MPTKTATENMDLAENDLDETRSNAGSDAVSEAPSEAPSEATVEFVPKEPAESDWPEAWPKAWPKPNMKDLDARLTEFKKAHKNVLPTEGQLAALVYTDTKQRSKLIKSTDNEALLYKLLLGVKNADGKLDQAGQKDSMRAKWKLQFPKTDRKQGAGFKAYMDEVMHAVDKTYVPMLEDAVAKLEEHAKGIDKGHRPTALLKQQRDNLKRVQDTAKARKERYEKEQKKRREAAQNKARKKGKRSKQSERTLSDSEKQGLNRRYFALVKKLREQDNEETGEKNTDEEAFELADEEYSKWEAELLAA